MVKLVQTETKLKNEVVPSSDRKHRVSGVCEDMSSIQFNAVLLNISNQLSDDQLEQIKFMCRDMIRKREMETIDTGIKMFQVLTERGKLGADNKDYLCQLLREIQRHDLSEKLDGFESHSGSTDNQPDKKENGRRLYEPYVEP